MSEPVHVLITKPLPTEQVTHIAAVSPRIVIEQVAASTPDDVRAASWQRAEVLYTAHVYPRIEQAPVLRWVHLHGAGTEKLRKEPLWQADVRLTNGSGVHAVAMGEYVLMMMLAFAHRLPEMVHHQQRNEWAANLLRNTLFPREIRGTTVGVIGYGSLGHEVGRLAHLFDMRVLGMGSGRPSSTTRAWTAPEIAGLPGGDADALYEPDQLLELLPQCDFVVLTVPYVPATHHLIDRAALAAMRSDAVLINVARGDVVDETALIEALRTGQIGGAALDVFHDEPLPPDSPLWRLENVIISPHLSGWTRNYDVRSANLFAENLRRYLVGEPLLNQIDRSRGY